MTLINARTVSERYSIPLGTIYYYLSKDQIPHYHIRGRTKFNPVEVEDGLRIVLNMFNLLYLKKNCMRKFERR